MKFELPEVKRCCCCVPLRYGIVSVGYIKLICALIATAFLIKNIVDIVNESVNYAGDIRIVQARARSLPLQLTVNAILLTILLLDKVFTTVLLVGGHQKSSKILRIFYIYSIVVTTIFTLLFLGLIIYLSYMFISYLLYHYSENQFMTMIEVMWTSVMMGFAILGIQVYFIILVRSEIKKLKNNCKFTFTNIANDYQCTLDYETSVIQTDDQIECQTDGLMSKD